jgi:Copine
LNYDSDKKVPIYGFGAVPRFPGFPRSVMHLFPLTGNTQQHEVMGIEGVLQSYGASLMNVDFAGPTYFGEIIKAAY